MATTDLGIRTVEAGNKMFGDHFHMMLRVTARLKEFVQSNCKTERECLEGKFCRTPLFWDALET